MSKTLKESLGYGKNYMFSISFEQADYDADGGKIVDNRGHILQREGDIYDIAAYASKYGIEPTEEGQPDWMTWNPVVDEMTGDRTYYYLNVRNIDGSSIAQEEKDDINNLLSDNYEENGMMINSVPFSVHW